MSQFVIIILPKSCLCLMGNKIYHLRQVASWLFTKRSFMWETIMANMFL